MLNKIKRVIKGIKLNASLIVNSRNDNTDSEFFSFEINEEGYIHRQNTVALMKSGVCVAGCTLVQFSTQLVPCIWTDDTFNKMSENGQKFVIYHELGHFIYHQDALMNGFERNIKMEQEADSYAAYVIGSENTIKGLEELKDMIDLISFGKSKNSTAEIEERIQYIKNQM
jgi:Zn-dependent peptidase ImmA (M78 family)